MGSEQFQTTSIGKTARIAFRNAVKQAQYDHGHSGYTGTIAEKEEFEEISVPEGVDVYDFVNKLFEERDSRIDDKCGPSGCVKVKAGEYYFFGWASS